MSTHLSLHITPSVDSVISASLPHIIGSWISIGDLAMYLLAFRMGMTFLKQLLGSLAGLYEDNLFVADVFEFLNLEEKVIALQPVVKIDKISNSLKLENISFKYPGAKKSVSILLGHTTGSPN